MTLTPRRYERLMGHFDALCDLPAAERAEQLEALRGEDPELCSELTRLLRHDSPEAVAGPGGGLRLGALAQLLAEEPAPGVPPEPAAALWQLAPPSRLVAERYEVGQPLGSGGAGVVFRALDRETSAQVAIKFLRPQPAEEPREVGRFRREFRAISRLSHPGCLKVFAEGLQGGQRYLVMEYVAGGDLSRQVGAEPSLLLYLLAQLAGALDYVHGRGIVHRGRLLSLLSVGESGT